MEDDNPIDVNLLKRMMMGEFSSLVQDKLECKPTNYKRRIELDLHFEKLFPTKASLPSKEKLRLQLDVLNDFIEDAKTTNIRSAYIIVGRGKGVLLKHTIQELNKKNITHSIINDPPYFGNTLKISF